MAKKAIFLAIWCLLNDCQIVPQTLNGHWKCSSIGNRTQKSDFAFTQTDIKHQMLFDPSLERWEKGSFSSSLTWLLSFKRVFPVCALRALPTLFYFKWPESMVTKCAKRKLGKKSFPWNFCIFIKAFDCIYSILETNHKLFASKDWFQWECTEYKMWYLKVLSKEKLKIGALGRVSQNANMF